MKKIFAANWKLNKTPAETRTFLQDLAAKAGDVSGEILIFPPATSWESAGAVAKTIKWGAQNIWSQGDGAFTGENSGKVLKALGGSHVLVGHSERRKIFGETDSLLADKVAYAQSLDLVPILCVGETLEEREKNKTDEVNKRQLEEGLKKSDKAKPIIIAYEPVWAIGTGKVATPEQVALAHAKIYEELGKLNLKNSPILYGGSVKPDNAKDLLKIPHVDGFLIGGASLEVESLLKIAKA